MDEKIMTIEELAALGNKGAPQEWLDNLTGEGIGGGYEGLDGADLDAIMADLPEVEQVIQATYEMAFKQCNAANYTKGRGGNSVQYIVVHYTAGRQTAEGAARANCIYFGRESVGASAHYFVDDGYTIWQSVKEGDTAWHAGNWAINQRSIGIEVCSAGAFTEREIDRLGWLVRLLMDRYGVPASRVIRHYDASGKHCPAYYVDAARWASLHAHITGGTPSTPSKPSTPEELDEDGKWGCDTTSALQLALGTYVDGEVFDQYSGHKANNPGLTTGWQWHAKTKDGSKVIRALQRKIGADPDGFIGPKTIKKLQRYLGTYVDGYFGYPSTCVEELQRRLNAGTF